MQDFHFEAVILTNQRKYILGQFRKRFGIVPRTVAPSCGDSGPVKCLEIPQISENRPMTENEFRPKQKYFPVSSS